MNKFDFSHSLGETIASNNGMGIVGGFLAFIIFVIMTACLIGFIVLMVAFVKGLFKLISEREDPMLKYHELSEQGFVNFANAMAAAKEKNPVFVQTQAQPPVNYISYVEEFPNQDFYIKNPCPSNYLEGPGQKLFLSNNTDRKRKKRQIGGFVIGLITGILFAVIVISFIVLI
jgi:uncharacterized membrane protein